MDRVGLQCLLVNDCSGGTRACHGEQQYEVEAEKGAVPWCCVAGLVLEMVYGGGGRVVTWRTFFDQYTRVVWQQTGGLDETTRNRIRGCLFPRRRNGELAGWPLLSSLRGGLTGQGSVMKDVKRIGVRGC